MKECHKGGLLGESLSVKTHIGIGESRTTLVLALPWQTATIGHGVSLYRKQGSWGGNNMYLR